MKKIIPLCALLISLSGAAQAGEEKPGEANPYGSFSATITAFSDYVDRGISQNNDRPGLQGSIDWKHDSGFYLGLWGSQVDFNDSHEAKAEIAPYAGYATDIGDFSIDAWVTQYFYPGAASSLDYDYWEASFALERDFEFVDLTGTFNYTPQNFGDSGDGTYVVLDASAPVLDTGLSLTGSIGHQQIDDELAYGTPDYNDWSLGAEYSWQGFDFALKYTDTDIKKSICDDGCDAMAVFTVSRTFGGE
jgi:uncharacterized protein (TIGR02001 family)